MNRKRLAIIAGIVILVSALMLMFWPDSQVDTHADEEVAETELPEGLVLIEQEQIRTAEIEVAAQPDQRAWLDRLRRVSDSRAALQELTPQLDPEFAAVLQSVLTAPMAESVSVKETFLRRLWSRPEGQGFRAQVALLRKRVPLLAELEPEWLDQVALREGPAFGRKHLAWILLACVYGLLMLLRLLGGAP